MKNINAETKLNLVIGNPIKQSKSPILHQKIYEALNINAVLLAVENPNLIVLKETIKNFSIRLTATTLPFKQDILKIADVVNEEAIALGAANTLILRDDKLHAYNTDVYGIQWALRHINLSDKTVLVLGAGGAARAVGYAIQKTAKNILWFNRSFDKAVEMENIFGGQAIPDVTGFAIDVIINTTPIGMYPNIADTPLPDYDFQSHQTILDLIYNPSKTKLLQQAQQKGAHCISGVDMFIAQGIYQVNLAYNTEIDFDSIKNLIGDLI